MEAIFLSQSLDREGRRLNTLKGIPGHSNSHHRSFDLGLLNGGAVLGGRGSAGVSIGPAWTDPYSILSYSNVGDLAYHARLPPSPLLPLPPLPLSRSYSSNVKAISYPPPTNSKNTKKPNKSPSSSSLASSPLTPKKSSPKSKPHPKKDQKNTPKQTTTPRPDPPELPRDSFKGSLNPGKQPTGSSSCATELSGPSIFILAPPPSSLPLPSFALRPKLGCNTEAAASASGISTKDTLRRIQRIP